MNQTEFGNKLAEVRKAKGLTQSELAEKCEVSYRTIQRIETGKVTPRGFTIKTLSVALDFDFLKVLSDNSAKNEETDSQRFITVQQIIEQVIDLFNLKTNAMRKLSILTVIFGLIGLGLFTVTSKVFAQDNSKFTNFLTIESNENMSKNEALKIISQINKKAKFHNESIYLIKTYVEKSDYNYDTYVLITKLISSFGHSTVPAMEIAQVLYFTYQDCDLINDIAPLIFLKTGIHNETFVKLAKSASRAQTDNEKDKIRLEIEEYKTKAKFKTLDEAFKNQ
jgi:transcriptional regulator with XRE-family HTH domain